MQEMKDAKSQSESQSATQPTQSTTLGTLENMAGKVVGCEGMVEGGEKRMPAKVGIEEQNGTG